MREFLKVSIFVLAFIALAMIATDIDGLGFGKGNGYEVDTVTVTVVVHDTVFQREPVQVDREVIKYVDVIIRDTVIRNDTVYVRLPFEQAVYSDSLYTAWISGYQPSLDSIMITHPATYTTYTYKITEKNKWGIGFSGGYGVGKNGFSPYIGIGVTYNIYSW